MKQITREFKIDWGGLIVDIVKKKDLDGGDFADCWDEDYDWSELDAFVVDNFQSDVIGYAEVQAEKGKIEITKKEMITELNQYRKELKQ